MKYVKRKKLLQLAAPQVQTQVGYHCCKACYQICYVCVSQSVSVYNCKVSHLHCFWNDHNAKKVVLYLPKIHLQFQLLSPYENISNCTVCNKHKIYSLIKDTLLNINSESPITAYIHPTSFVKIAPV